MFYFSIIIAVSSHSLLICWLLCIVEVWWGESVCSFWVKPWGYINRLCRWLGLLHLSKHLKTNNRDNYSPSFHKLSSYEHQPITTFGSHLLWALDWSHSRTIRRLFCSNRSDGFGGEKRKTIFCKYVFPSINVWAQLLSGTTAPEDPHSVL